MMDADTTETRRLFDRIRRSRPSLRESLRRVRWHVVVAIGLFVAGFLLVFFTADPTGNVEANSPWEDLDNPTVVDFGVNNSIAALFLLGGTVSLALMAIVGCLFNGFILGGVVRDLYASEAAIAEIVLSIAPHAVVELPALWLAAGIGFYVPNRLALYLIGRRDRILRLDELLGLVQVALTSLLLIWVAAFIEAHLTTTIVDYIA